MVELKIFRGPPASGKTSVATLMQNTHTRVNRDEIRYTMYGTWFGGRVDEGVVTAVENTMIEAALRAGQNVVSDATNLNNKFMKTKLSLAARYGAEVSFHDFEIPLAEAIARDAVRVRSVGERVIRGFYKQGKINPDTGALKPPPKPLPTFEPYVCDLTRPPAFIVDTDGTLANHEGVRSPYDTSRYHLDTVHEHMKAVTNALFSTFESRTQVVLLSGRSDEFINETCKWYVDNGINFDHLFMRAKDDSRMDAIVKYEIFKRDIEPHFNVLGAFDDRPQVIRMWETIGVPVFRVGPGLEF